MAGVRHRAAPYLSSTPMSYSYPRRLARCAVDTYTMPHQVSISCPHPKNDLHLSAALLRGILHLANTSRGDLCEREGISCAAGCVGLQPYGGLYNNAADGTGLRTAAARRDQRGRPGTGDRDTEVMRWRTAWIRYRTAAIPALRCW